MFDSGQAAASHDRRSRFEVRQRLARLRLSGRWLVYAVAVAVALLVWTMLARLTTPLFLPGPGRVWDAAVQLGARGELWGHVRISFARVLGGWLIGSVIAIPLGLVAGRISLLRTALEPAINFLRFIPPIAFITLALIWLGIGEESKVALIVYSAMFVVFLNTVAGAQSVSTERIRAAQCLGASHRRVITSVVIPSTIPQIVTGLRIAMGYAFMTVVAAEMIAAKSGVGFLIFNARVYARTDEVFVGIVALGVMGFTADLLFRMLIGRLAYRYEIRF